MGLTQKLGTIPLAILTDASNNVGIGGSPSGTYKLEVTGTGRFSSSLQLSGGASVGPQFSIFSNNQTTNNVSLSQGFATATDNIGYLYNRANADFVFGTNNAERIRIPAGGGLGIGISNPDLYAFGGNLLALSSTTTYSNIIIASSGTNSSGLQFGNQTIRRASIESNEGSNILFLTNSTNSGTSVTEKMRISADGSMGFGSSVISSRSFTFKAITGRTIVIEAIENANVHSIYLRPNNSGYNFISSNYLSGGVYLPLSLSARENTSDLVLGTNGNVGIGTTSPDSKLQVAGTCKIDSTFTSVAEIVLGSNGNYPAGGFGFRNDSVNMIIYFGSTACIFKDTTNVERMRITAAGEVGIGFYDAGVSLMIQSKSATSSTYIIYGRNSTPTGQFYVRSDAYGFLNNSAWAYGSDRRLKENISYLTESGIEKILKLKPARFDYIDGTKNNIGWIAQDVQEVIEEAVNISNEETGMLALKSDYIVPYLVKAVQELSVQNQDLKSRLDKAGL